MFKAYLRLVMIHISGKLLYDNCLEIIKILELCLKIPNRVKQGSDRLNLSLTIGNTQKMLLHKFIDINIFIIQALI